MLRAVNDRAITRLVVEEGEPRDPDLGPEERASARARITSCLAYSASGRVAGADVRVAANAVVEGYVDATLDPERRAAEQTPAPTRSRPAGMRSHPVSACASGASAKGWSRPVCRSRPTGASSWTKRSHGSFDR